MTRLLLAAVIAAAMTASLAGVAYSQMSPSDRKKQEALDKAQQLKTEDTAYKAATDTMPTQNTATDPWSGIRPAASTPAPKSGPKTGSKTGR